MNANNRIDIAGAKAAEATKGLPAGQRADAIEEAMARALAAEQLPPLPAKSMIYTSGEEDPTAPRPPMAIPGRVMLMDQDPRLKRVPERATLVDIFRLRCRPTHQHLLQSAALAQKNGCSEKIILACLLHDFSVSCFIQADHGYWGAQLMEPYVD